MYQLRNKPFMSSIHFFVDFYICIDHPTDRDKWWTDVAFWLIETAREVLSPRWPDEFMKNRPKFRPRHFFVKISAKPQQSKKWPKNVGYICIFQSIYPKLTTAIGRIFAQSGRPGYHLAIFRVSLSVMNNNVQLS
jgi:hypothetical protein